MTINIRESDIAIIGISCRFPGAKDVNAFWQNLQDGIESISFFYNDELEQGDQSLLRNPKYVKAGAVLPNIEEFDAEFFGYSTREAEIMDPQQRIFLECAWEALESAGYNPETYQGLIGVYAGSGMNTYLHNNVHPNRGFSPARTFLESTNDLQVRLGNEKDFLPTRVSYKLNLTGPSVNIQTACSTALVAVHMACQSLLNGECDIVLAGGVAVCVPQKMGYLYQEDMIWSPDGHCRAFDAEAKGTVFGNGGGIVVLKLLSQAIADGDCIHAVIKGSAINNDGAAKVGYTAPSVEGQAAVISEALAVAQIDPSTVTYLETHGTATSLGDPVEIAALTKAFRQSTNKKGFCAIGSVKTNIGHIAEAAGIAGLIKTVLALKHKELPPSLHFSQPNPNIDFANSPFYVNTTLSEWKANGTPRRAGVSAFGMGGTNCHLVLEEAPQETKNQESNERPLHILTLAAKTQKALEELAQNYVVYLKSHPDVSLADICFTGNAGRKHFNHRFAVTAFSLEQLCDRLSNLGQESADVAIGSANNSQSKDAIAFLFTGQGSQYVNMGRQLYQTQPIFRETLNRCDEILRPYLEVSLLEILYPNSDRSHPKLDETAYTQPALFALEYALFQLWKSWGIEPNFVTGHSVGEYVAACVAGVFSLEDGLKLIASRGRLMQALPQDGEMVALLTDEAQALAAIQPYVQEVSIAAINAPESIVISGRREAINSICATLEASGIKTKKLNVSHAFHSPLMKSVLVEFERVARQVSFSLPRIKLISNVTGTEATEEIATPEYWCRHVLQPVRFAASVESLERHGVEVFVEIGPKPILLGMASLCLPDKKALWLPSLHPDRDDWQVLLTSLAELYVRGASVNWLNFDQGYSRRRQHLPTYPFQRQRYWVEAGGERANRTLSQNNTARSQNLHPLLGQQLYLAATQEIRFQSQISQDFPFWLKDHCLFGKTILPGTGYLEMALAAGSVVAKADNLSLEDVVFQQALIWQEDEVKTVQVILAPQEANVYSFKVYSLEPSTDKNNPHPSWTLHTSGKLVIKEEKELVAESVDLAEIKAQCTQEIPIDQLYRRFQQQKLDYGSSFQGIKQLFRYEGVALGKIELAEEVVSQLEDYQLHPVLLDIALQVLDVISPDDEKQNTYVPVGLERLRVYGRPSVSMWSYARKRKVEGEGQQQQILNADIELFADSGELIAVLEGVQLKPVRREAMLGIPQESWENWLYEVKWIPQVRYGLPVDYMPTANEISDRLLPQFTDLLTHPSLAVYGEIFTQLEALSVAYVLVAFQEMGWKFQLGERFSTEQIAQYLGVVSQHRQLLSRLLQMLASEGILQQIGKQWQVNSTPEIQDPSKVINSLSCPEAEAEITLLTRCGFKIAQVLQGACEPLQLLFPEGDTTTLSKLYQHSPMLRTMNVLVQKAVIAALERLPQGRGWRILEIGAGTGSTTNYILPHLSTERTEYVFTDIGALFVEQAQEKFKAYPFVRYEVLDIEKDPQSQGFKRHQYDLVVAVNVLDATRNLRTSLQHVQQLLAPGGMLVLMEGTAPVRWIDLTFGLLEGWWKFADHQLRPDYPLLPTRSWQKLLQEIGFKEILKVEPDLSVTQGIVFMPQSAIVAQATAAIPDPSTKKNWLIFADGLEVGQQLAALLRGKEENCTIVLPGNEYQQITDREFRIDPANAEHFQQLCEAVPSIQGVVHLWSLDAPQTQASSDLEIASKVSCGSTLYLVQALVKNYSEPPSLWLVTQGAQAVGIASGVPGVAQSSLWGMGKVIALEHPELNCVRLDLDPDAPDAVRVIFEEISSQTPEDQVAFRKGTRYVARLVRRKPPASWLRSESFQLKTSEQRIGDAASHSVSFRQDSSYMITGGLGDLGLLVASWMVECGVRHLVLVGRSAVKPAVRSQLEQLELSGARVVVAQADVSDYEQVSQLLNSLVQSSPPLRGIIHAAGVLDKGLMQQQNWEQFTRVMAPKVLGAWNLHALTQNQALDFFVLFSSVSSLFGAVNQTSYSAANAFLDALASYRRAQGLPGSSINWGLWGEVGMGARNQQLAERLNRMGMENMAPQQGLQVLEKFFKEAPVQLGVMSINWSRFLVGQLAKSPFLADLSGETQGLRSQSWEESPKSESPSLRNALVSATLAERKQLLKSHICEQVAKVLGFSATKLDIAKPLTSLGLDSLMAIELRNRLNKETGVNLPVMKIIQGPSISQLAELILEELALAKIMLSALPSTELAEDMEEITL
ncbi:type I polyketide synthase [Microseira wollei]|uniref:Beta-ketoacyl synthase n=1 Tax=Microseira wollei NIES-4236 TaxID=2530354 RepID=A0AAV3X9F0_9CYAN|nr:type I polyketide synthase [Microseira wollei]GET38793.1 beta-ketoacyl synthase [Microseira wollei NIES-4236]